MSSSVQCPPPIAARVRQAARDAWLCFLEARPVVQGVFLLRFIVGAVVAMGDHPVGPALFVAGLSWSLAVWAIYLVNGISDLDGDRRNGSARPLASGALARAAAVQWAWLLSLGAAVTAVFVSAGFAVAVCLMLCLGLAYSVGPLAAKRRAVTALVVAGGGVFLTYAAGAVAAGGPLDPADVAFAAVVSLWVVVAGHTKDLGDTDGDVLAGRRTLPLILGDRAARAVMAAGTAMVAALACAVAVGIPRLSVLALFVPAAALVVLFLALARADRPRSVKRPYRTFMIAQYGVNLAALILLGAD